jgi:hypothetical protein
VLGHVDESGHRGQAGPQHRLDALPEGDLGQAAALAAAFEADPDPAAGHAGHGDPAAVGAMAGLISASRMARAASARSPASGVAGPAAASLTAVTPGTAARSCASIRPRIGSTAPGSRPRPG